VLPLLQWTEFWGLQSHSLHCRCVVIFSMVKSSLILSTAVPLVLCDSRALHFSNTNRLWALPCTTSCFFTTPDAFSLPFERLNSFYLLSTFYSPKISQKHPFHHSLPSYPCPPPKNPLFPPFHPSPVKIIDFGLMISSPGFSSMASGILYQAKRRNQLQNLRLQTLRAKLSPLQFLWMRTSWRDGRLRLRGLLVR
jgi:hypothetical protein